MPNNWTKEDWREYRARRKVGAALKLVLPEGKKLEDFPTITDELLRRTLSAITILVARDSMYLSKTLAPGTAEAKTLTSYLQCLDLIISIKGKITAPEDEEEAEASAKDLSDDDLAALAAGGTNDG